MNKEQATIHLDMFDRMREFNDEWKKVFQRNRLTWLTSNSHMFLEFAERFVVKSFHNPTEDDQRHNFHWQLETTDGLFLIRRNQTTGPYMLSNLKVNNRRIVLTQAVGITYEDMQVFHQALDEAGLKKMINDLLHLNEMKKWHGFVEQYQEKLQGKFEYKGINSKPLLIIDAQAIDLTPLYKAYKRKG